MLPLTGYFKNMQKLIRPSAERQRLADTLPDDVRTHLQKSDRLNTVTDAPVTRLAGSYGRKTGQGDIHDVDILVFVDSSYEAQAAEVVLDDLADALKELEVDGYGKGEVKTSRKNRRSHHVEFKRDAEKSFHIDCVPVVRSGDDPDAVLRIPDREWVGWDDTQPLGYGTQLIELNGANDRKVKRTIRMFKRIREHNLRKGLKRPKSYWLEAKVYAIWKSGRLNGDWSYADLMYQLVNAFRADCGSAPLAIYDPCLGRNLTATWEQAEYNEFVEMLDKVIGYLDPIADEGDSEKAVAAWQKVFGADVFRLDSDDEQETKKAAEALAGGVTVTRAGLVVPTASGVRGTSAPPHSFYGDD
jgi:Second Messenger Oligonucleotide or Dinucleotide Synthetase domain